ncbi:glycerophosphodiester phosphodiesterase family protein [Microbacterium gorillae]|uniref:glycerophosphodiester phosphodiesterase family protein n=1 Tax=Microbacterium gorillae TaxID=1231063 RepID=UPI00058B87DC|nr:glycerophosphodiester phosphodiesterase family protein [Microbacterium gorillae]
MFGQSRYAAQNARINRLAAERGVLIAAHRGTATGTIMENTLPAVQAAVRSGATIVEIDVIASTDGDHFLFHDGLEPQRFGTHQNINSMSTTQIRELTYVEMNSTASAPRVEELAPVLERFRGEDVLFNVDRSWWYWDSLLPRLDEFEMADQLVLKSNVDDASLERLRRHPVKYPFIPMVHSLAQIEKVFGDEEINLVGVELIAADRSHEFLAPGAIDELRARGLACLLNAINLNNRVPLFAGFDDETSVLGDPDAGWGELLRLGADLIQTDWTSLLGDYLVAAGVSREFDALTPVRSRS